MCEYFHLRNHFSNISHANIFPVRFIIVFKGRGILIPIYQYAMYIVRIHISDDYLIIKYEIYDYIFKV